MFNIFNHLLMSIFGVSSGYLQDEGKAEMSKLPVSNWCSCRIDKIYLFAPSDICLLEKIFISLCSNKSSNIPP